MYGPRELNEAIACVQYPFTPTSPGLHAAATVIAVRALPGDWIVDAPDPVFPAATVTVTPAAVAASTAKLMASSGFPEPPKLKLATST
jgi:hypothetical protein